MSAYTVKSNPTGPSPVRNPGVRAVLAARAEREGAAQQQANNLALWWYLNRRTATTQGAAR